VVGDLAETAVIVDDMIDTGGRLINAAETLKKNGAKRVFACCTHAVFSGNMQELQQSDVCVSVFFPDFYGFRSMKWLLLIA
jgi:ribose-phosphate pyrophosphokinase